MTEIPLAGLKPSSLITSKDVARRLGVTRQRVAHLARAQLIPHVRIGRQLRFEPSSIETWISSGGLSLAGGWKKNRSDESAENP